MGRGLFRIAFLNASSISSVVSKDSGNAISPHLLLMTTLRTSFEGLYRATKSKRSLALRSGMQVINVDYKWLFIFNPFLHEWVLLNLWAG